jgi:hypothetical protein
MFDVMKLEFGRAVTRRKSKAVFKKANNDQGDDWALAKPGLRSPRRRKGTEARPGFREHSCMHGSRSQSLTTFVAPAQKVSQLRADCELTHHLSLHSSTKPGQRS